MTKCEAKTLKGTDCRNVALKDTHFCAKHTPAHVSSTRRSAVAKAKGHLGDRQYLNPKELKAKYSQPMEHVHANGDDDEDEYELYNASRNPDRVNSMPPWSERKGGGHRRLSKFAFAF